MKISVLILVLCYCAAALAAPATDENTAKTFIKESSDDFYELYDMISSLVFSFDVPETMANIATSAAASSEELTDSDEQGVVEFLQILMKLGVLAQAAENITTLAKEADRFPIKDFKDEEVKIGLMNTKLSPGLFVAEDEYTEWLVDDFEEIQNKNDICDFKKPEKCDLKYNEIIKIMKKTDNGEELLHYWKQWRNNHKKETVEKLKEFIKLMTAAAEKYKISPSLLWFRSYLDENFLTEMEKVVKEIEPFYKDLYSYIRHAMVEKYGADVVSPTEPIKHHFFEQVMTQAWKPDSFIAKYFEGVKMPATLELPAKFTGEKVVHLADDFMKKMGFSELPSEFWKERISSYPETDEDCTAEVYDISRKAFFKYCAKTNIKKFLQNHGFLARLHYSNQKKVLPFAYSHSYDFEYAVGEAVILSTSTPQYLKEVGIREEPTLTPKEDLNRMYRMAVHTILNIPVYFVHSKLIADVLEGKVTVNDMNKHYWDLMKQYVGVTPPTDLGADSIDFPYKFFDDIDENHQTTKFVSEVVGYQIYESVCKKSGQFVENNPDLSLHNCNFYGNKDAGKMLLDMMQVGSKQPWKKVLNHVTGTETGMTGDAIMEYYKPLRTWIKTENAQHGVKIGW